MRSISACFGLFGWGVMVVASCSGSAGDLFPPGGGGTGPAGFGGRGGRGGTGNIGGRSGSSAGGEAGSLGGGAPDGGPVEGDGGVGCGDACDDGNDCTVDICDGDECRHSLQEEGALCGSGRDDECTAPDTCDAQGACVANDAPHGSECSGGSCTLGECIEGQPVGCPAQVVPGLPFQTGWRTVGGINLYTGRCDVPNTADFAVLFTAPEDGTYLFEAAGAEGEDDPESGGDASELADSVLTIAEGACGGFGAPIIDCNDDIATGNLDSRITLDLVEGETITIYVNEYGEVLPGGGSGTLSISLLE